MIDTREETIAYALAEELAAPLAKNIAKKIAKKELGYDLPGNKECNLTKDIQCQLEGLLYDGIITLSRLKVFLNNEDKPQQ